MPEQDNDLNNDQSVTDPNLTAEPVTQQDLTDQPVQDQNQDLLADGTSKDKPVPYSELEKATKRARDAEEQTAYAQRQLDLIQQNAQQPVQQTAPKTVSDQALDNCGLTADDLFGENIVRYQNEKDRLSGIQSQQVQQAMSTQQFAVSHPDINEVVGSVNLATGQIIAPTAELLALVQKKPYLAQASTASIYEAVLQERELNEFKKKAEVQKEHLIRQGVQVTTQPLGGSAAGGGGGAGSQQGQQVLTRQQTLQIEADIKAGKYS